MPQNMQERVLSTQTFAYGCLCVSIYTLTEHFIRKTNAIYSANHVVKMQVINSGKHQLVASRILKLSSHPPSQ